MSRFALAILLAAIAGPALAQAAPPSDGKAMRLTVRPSGYDAEQNEATERQQKLLKRLEQSDHMIRSICINCGDSWKHQIYTPFNPFAALRSSAQPSGELDQ